MVPGTDPDGRRAEVRNLRNGATVTALMREGGFDPIAVQAEAGDTLSVTVVHQAGDDTTSYSIVPLKSRPTVVRTSPSMGKTDVPLNSLILVVFNEPMDAASLPGAFQVLQDGVEVPGEVESTTGGVILSVRFVPRSPLVPLSTYELSVSTGARSLNGASLEAGITLSFTTSSEGSGEFRNLTGVYDLTSVITSSDPAWGIPDGTLQLAVLTIQHSTDASQLTGTFSDFRAVAPGEEPPPCCGPAGIITGFVVGSGRVVIELTMEGSQSSYWYGEGVPDPGQIVGWYGAGGHIGGTFTAVRR